MKGCKKDTTSRSPSISSSTDDTISSSEQVSNQNQNKNVSSLESQNHKNSISQSNKYASLKELMQSIGDPLSSKKHLFTPSTPYVHKFRTEMCKNYELYKKCKYGDEVSIDRVKNIILFCEKLCVSYNNIILIIVFVCPWQIADHDQERCLGIVQDQALQEVPHQWFLSIRSKMPIHPWGIGSGLPRVTYSLSPIWIRSLARSDPNQGTSQ